ncbi:MAG: sigma-70 family RNA polymerase sigma factor [Bacteroidota bacterium]
MNAFYEGLMFQDFIDNPALSERVLGFAMTQKHYKLVSKIIKKYDLGYTVEAEDVMQELLLKLMEKHAINEDLFPGKTAKEPHLASITHCLCKDIYRYEKRRASGNIKLPTYFNSVLINEDSKGGAEIEFSFALAMLSKSEKEVLELIRKGYSHSDVARELGIKESASRKRLQRARTKLRNALKTEYTT